MSARAPRVITRPQLSMMRYAVWMQQDMVIATGQVEGAVRHLVGERFDCAGMRWVRSRAEALLHLRCIELKTGKERWGGQGSQLLGGGCWSGRWWSC